MREMIGRVKLEIGLYSENFVARFIKVENGQIYNQFLRSQFTRDFSEFIYENLVIKKIVLHLNFNK